jgi:GNAT superfamily N-acetyltransferase
MRIFEIMKVGKINVASDEFSSIKNILSRSETAKLPGDNDLYYAVDSKGSEIKIYIYKKTESTRANDGKLVGKLFVEPEDFPLKDAHTVNSIAVDPNYRGQGIAKSLYGIYFTKLRKPLLSGGGQTAGGRRNWLSLANIPGVVVKGWVSVHDDLFGVEDGETFGMNPRMSIDTMINKIMEAGGEYIGEIKNRHYFAFEVVPGNGELAPVAKRALSPYSKYDFGYQTGLYAIWTGR